MFDASEEDFKGRAEYWLNTISNISKIDSKIFCILIASHKDQCPPQRIEYIHLILNNLKSIYRFVIYTNFLNLKEDSLQPIKENLLQISSKFTNFKVPLFHYHMVQLIDYYSILYKSTPSTSLSTSLSISSPNSSPITSPVNSPINSPHYSPIHSPYNSPQQSPISSPRSPPSSGKSTSSLSSSQPNNILSPSLRFTSISSSRVNSTSISPSIQSSPFSLKTSKSKLSSTSPSLRIKSISTDSNAPNSPLLKYIRTSTISSSPLKPFPEKNDSSSKKGIESKGIENEKKLNENEKDSNPPEIINRNSAPNFFRSYPQLLDQTQEKIKEILDINEWKELLSFIQINRSKKKDNMQLSDGPSFQIGHNNQKEKLEESKQEEREMVEGMKYLKDIGRIIYFEEEREQEELLGESVIMDIAYLAKKMCDLISFKNNWANGTIPLSFFSQIYHDLPAHHVASLLLLFERFEIIFRFQDENEKKIIIPSLLPRKPPSPFLLTPFSFFLMHSFSVLFFYFL